MANTTRERAKEHFPAVLLTLLSIMQAIALELLWSYIVDSPYLYETTLTALLGWTQVAASFTGVMLLWVVYASNVMRFRWVPAVTDSVYPFIVGILEFWLIEALGPDTAWLWFVVMALVFATMTAIAQITMRRARFDADNAQFFDSVEPAKPVDFLPQGLVFLVITSFGLATWGFGLSDTVVLAGSVVVLAFLCWQFFDTTRFWNAAVALD